MSIQATIEGISDDLIQVGIGGRVYQFTVRLLTENDYVSIDFGSDKEVTVYFNGSWTLRPSGFPKEDTKYIHVDQHEVSDKYSDILAVMIDEPSFTVYETVHGQTREVYD